ncbi:MAG: alpha-E domain-containing protein [Planctomycetales bacterium]|nr:alpha-E domain-containing protein [Planctomycetales bacterium]
MLSRVANSIYWMGRYVERAENLARFIDVTLNLLLDQPDNLAPQWEPLVRATGDDATFQERYGQPTRDNVICFLTFDLDYPNSILSALAAARENARTVREVIPSESWEQLNEFYLFVKEASVTDDASDNPSDFFTEVKRQSHLFNGIIDATMSHGMGWNFLNLGRLLERADKTSRILDVKYFTLLPSVQDVGTTIDYLQWSAVLRSVSGFEMYRKLHHAITVRRIVEFLVLSREFPRSIVYCVTQAGRSLHEITGTPERMFRNPPEQQLGRLQSELAYHDVDEILEQGMHEFIDGLQRQLNQFDSAIAETFFGMKPASGQASQSSTQ